MFFMHLKKTHDELSSNNNSSRTIIFVKHTAEFKLEGSNFLLIESNISKKQYKIFRTTDREN